MDTHLALKHTVQATQSHDNSLRKINKLHDKLVQGKEEKVERQTGDDKPELSVKAAMKLLIAYESAVKSCRSLQESIEHSLEKVRAPAEEPVQMDIDSTMEPVQVEPAPSPVSSANPVIEESHNFEEAPTKRTEERAMSGSEAFLPVGTLVAVLCRVEEDSESDEWMLATVKGYSMETNLYEVEDCELIEPVEGEVGEAMISQTGQGKRRTAPLAKIIHLPQSDAESHSIEEHKTKSKILALYPGTTCLYPAQVISPPSKRKKTNDYLVKFSDDEVPSRTCPAKYLVTMPDIIA